MRPTLAAIAVLLITGPASADPAEGVWRTGLNDAGNFGHVAVAPCGAALCGTLVGTFDGRGRPIENPAGRVRIIAGMTPSGGGAYAGGTITDPQAGRTYRAKMRLSGDAMAVSGCVAGGLICRSQTWTRLR